MFGAAFKITCELYFQTDDVDLKSFWKQAAEFYLRENNPQAAVKCLHNLLSLDPQDQKTIAKLVIAYVQVRLSIIIMKIVFKFLFQSQMLLQFDKQKAAEFCDKLPPINVDHVDISALENISWHTNKQKKLKVQPSPG